MIGGISVLKASDIIAYLQTLGNAKNAEHAQRFFKTAPGEYGEGDSFLGIRVPVLRRELKRHRGLSLTENLKLLKSEFHEVRLFALLLMVDAYQRSDDAVRLKVFKQYLSHTRYINNWDLVDSSAPQIVGAQLCGRNTERLDKLARSSLLWERRIAIIASYSMIRAGSFDDTLRLAKILLNDSEDLIHKAVGWMLREVGNRNRCAEEAFLQEHYPQMPRTMLRYAIEKFPEKRRQDYLQGRI